MLKLAALFAMVASMAGLAGAQTAASPTELRIANGPIPIRILVQSPAETSTELQIICLFRSEPANTLHGSLLEINEKLMGLLDRIRKPELFRGELGETLMIAPPAGGMAAKRLLIIGLGDAKTFTPERMEFVGAVVYREASRVGAAHPFFAPTVIDGGITGFAVGDVSRQVMSGFLRGERTKKIISESGASAQRVIQDLTFLAGTQHAAETQQGIEKAIADARK